MTDEQIQQACLIAYQEALENLPNDFDDALDYLVDRFLYFGLCFYTDCVLGKKVRAKKWITDNREKDDFWAPPPAKCETIEEIRQSLQFRINKLKELGLKK